MLPAPLTFEDVIYFNYINFLANHSNISGITLSPQDNALLERIQGLTNGNGHNFAENKGIIGVVFYHDMFNRQGALLGPTGEIAVNSIDDVFNQVISDRMSDERGLLAIDSSVESDFNHSREGGYVWGGLKRFHYSTVCAPTAWNNATSKIVIQMPSKKPDEIGDYLMNLLLPSTAGRGTRTQAMLGAVLLGPCENIETRDTPAYAEVLGVKETQIGDHWGTVVRLTCASSPLDNINNNIGYSYEEVLYLEEKDISTLLGESYELDKLQQYQIGNSGIYMVKRTYRYDRSIAIDGRLSNPVYEFVNPQKVLENMHNKRAGLYNVDIFVPLS
ncbi:MAG: hypothetical protein V1859_07950 [archaeon]